jgi:hypothetical protein
MRQGNSNTYAIRFPDGRYLGRFNLRSPLAPQSPALASVFTDREETEALAATYVGSSVVPAPRWDSKLKRYI